MISTKFHELWLPYVPVKLEECHRYQSRERVSGFEDRINQSSSFMDILAGITAKTVIKSLIPDFAHRLKQNLKVFGRQIASTAILRGELIPQPPQCHLLPQKAPTEDEFIEQDQILCLEQPKKLLLHRISTTECLQSNPNSTQSLKGQYKLSSSLLLKCKHINAI